MFHKIQEIRQRKKKINQKMIPLETLSYNFTKFFSFFNRAPPRDFFWIYLQDVMILSVETSFIKKTRDLHYIYPSKSKF